MNRLKPVNTLKALICAVLQRCGSGLDTFNGGYFINSFLLMGQAKGCLIALPSTWLEHSRC